MKLTDQVSDLSKRVTALESGDIDDSATIAQITKIYGGLKFTAVIAVRTHTYRNCGDTNPLYGATLGTETYM